MKDPSLCGFRVCCAVLCLLHVRCVCTAADVMQQESERLILLSSTHTRELHCCCCCERTHTAQTQTGSGSMQMRLERRGRRLQVQTEPLRVTAWIRIRKAALERAHRHTPALEKMCSATRKCGECKMMRWESSGRSESEVGVIVYLWNNTTERNALAGGFLDCYYSIQQFG